MFDVNLLTAGYGGSRILHGVKFQVTNGQIFGVVGRNGVGKTTLLKALMGLLPEVNGRVDLLGKSLVGLPTYKIARMGIGYVPQGRQIFPKLTVLENLQIATRAAGVGRSDIPESIFSYFPILRKRLSQSGGTMSGGEQQMLAIGRALCGRPKVLLMDEPTDGVQPNIVQMLGELMPSIVRDTGAAIVIVEQNLDLVLRVAQRCLVMDRGTIVHELGASELAESEPLRRLLTL